MAETNHGRNNHRSRLDRSNCCKSSLHVSGNLSICPDKFNKFELRNSLFVVVDQEIEISDKFESVIKQILPLRKIYSQLQRI